MALLTIVDAAHQNTSVESMKETVILMMSALQIWSVEQTTAETSILGRENFMTAVWMVSAAGLSIFLSFNF